MLGVYPLELGMVHGAVGYFKGMVRGCFGLVSFFAVLSFRGAGAAGIILGPVGLGSTS
jgi:hypothetical protein